MQQFHVAWQTCSALSSSLLNAAQTYQVVAHGAPSLWNSSLPMSLAWRAHFQRRAKELYPEFTVLHHAAIAFEALWISGLAVTDGSNGVLF